MAQVFLLGGVPLGRRFIGIPISSLAQSPGNNTHWAQIDSISASSL